MIANNVAGLAGGGISIDGLPCGRNRGLGGHHAQHDRRQRQHGHGRGGVQRRSAHLRTAAGWHRGREESRAARDGSQTRSSGTTGPSTSDACTLCRPDRRSAGSCRSARTPGPTQYGEIQITARPYWDIAILSGSGQFSPIATVLSCAEPDPAARRTTSRAPTTSTTTERQLGHRHDQPVRDALLQRRSPARVPGRRDNRRSHAHLDSGGPRRGRELHPAAVRSAVAHHRQRRLLSSATTT